MKEKYHLVFVDYILPVFQNQNAGRQRPLPAQEFYVFFQMPWYRALAKCVYFPCSASSVTRFIPPSSGEYVKETVSPV